MNSLRISVPRVLGVLLGLCLSTSSTAGIADTGKTKAGNERIARVRVTSEGLLQSGDTGVENYLSVHSRRGTVSYSHLFLLADGTLAGRDSDFIFYPIRLDPKTGEFQHGERGESRNRPFTYEPTVAELRDYLLAIQAGDKGAIALFLERYPASPAVNGSPNVPKSGLFPSGGSDTYTTVAGVQHERCENGYCTGRDSTSDTVAVNAVSSDKNIPRRYHLWSTSSERIMSPAGTLTERQGTNFCGSTILNKRVLEGSPAPSGEKKEEGTAAKTCEFTAGSAAHCFNVLRPTSSFQVGPVKLARNEVEVVMPQSFVNAVRSRVIGIEDRALLFFKAACSQIPDEHVTPIAPASIPAGGQILVKNQKGLVFSGNVNLGACEGQARVEFGKTVVDPSIIGGDSGGPVFDSQGRWLGAVARAPRAELMQDAFGRLVRPMVNDLFCFDDGAPAWARAVMAARAGGNGYGPGNVELAAAVAGRNVAEVPPSLPSPKERAPIPGPPQEPNTPGGGGGGSPRGERYLVDNEWRDHIPLAGNVIAINGHSVPQGATGYRLPGGGQVEWVFGGGSTPGKAAPSAPKEEAPGPRTPANPKLAGPPAIPGPRLPGRSVASDPLAPPGKGSHGGAIEKIDPTVLKSLGTCVACHRNRDGVPEVLGDANALASRLALMPEDQYRLLKERMDGYRKGLNWTPIDRFHEEAGKLRSTLFGGGKQPAAEKACFQFMEEGKRKRYLGTLPSSFSGASPGAKLIEAALRSDRMIPYTRDEVPRLFQSTEDHGKLSLRCETCDDNGYIKKKGQPIRNAFAEAPWKHPAGGDNLNPETSDHFNVVIGPEGGGPIATLRREARVPDGSRSAIDGTPGYKDSFYYKGAISHQGNILTAELKPGTHLLEVDRIKNPVTGEMVTWRIRRQSFMANPANPSEGYWDEDVLSPFADAQDMLAAVKKLCEAEPRWKSNPQVVSFLQSVGSGLPWEEIRIEDFYSASDLRTNTLAASALKSRASVQKTPPLPPEVTAKILTMTPFKSVPKTGSTLIGSQDFGFPPKGEGSPLIKNCATCHDSSLRDFHHFDTPARLHTSPGRVDHTWYGHHSGTGVQGNTGISAPRGALSLHFFDPSRVRATGFDTDPRINPVLSKCVEEGRP